MKNNAPKKWILFLIFTFFFGFPNTVFSQNNPNNPQPDFWDKVQFGGGIGLGFGNEYTDITLAPIMYYNFNEKFALGTGIQYSHLNQKNVYTSNVLGASLTGLYNPIENIQLSLEIEEVHVSNKYTEFYNSTKEAFWNTGLFVGGGYRAENVVIGFRYNLLFDKSKNIYGDAFMPFIRVFF